MIETRAIVVSVNGSDAIVEPMDAGGCGHCAGGSKCGSSKLSALARGGPRRVCARNDANARVGDEVRISMSDGTLLRSALLLYGLPLMLLLAGAFAGMHIQGGDAGAVVGATTGLTFGFLAARFATVRQGATSAAEPVIICKED